MTGVHEARAPIPPLAGAMLVLTAGLWGIQFPIMKIAFTEIGPWTFRGTGAVFGGGFLLLLAVLTRQRLRVPAAEVPRLLLISVFAITGVHLLSGLGVTLMQPGRAIILFFTMPLWATLLSILVLGERLTVERGAALVLGITGIALLVGQDIRQLGTDPAGPALVIAAAVSWAIGAVLIKRYRWTSPTLALAAWQLVAGGVPIAAGSLILESGIADIAGASRPVALAMVYNVAAANSICIYFWFHLLRTLPTPVAAIGTLAVPVIGVFASNLMIGEAIHGHELAALALIVIALALVLIGREGTRALLAWARSRGEPPPARPAPGRGGQKREPGRGDR